jgi:hypothetical protein
VILIIGSLLHPNLQTRLAPALASLVALGCLLGVSEQVLDRLHPPEAREHPARVLAGQQRVPRAPEDLGWPMGPRSAVRHELRDGALFARSVLATAPRRSPSAAPSLGLAETPSQRDEPSDTV